MTRDLDKLEAVFKAAWKRGDEAGATGARVRLGLLAVFDELDTPEEISTPRFELYELEGGFYAVADTVTRREALTTYPDGRAVDVATKLDRGDGGTTRPLGFYGSAEDKGVLETRRVRSFVRAFDLPEVLS